MEEYKEMEEAHLLLKIPGQKWYTSLPLYCEN